MHCGRSGGILEARQRKVPADQVGGQFRNECPYSEKIEIRENALRAEWGGYLRRGREKCQQTEWGDTPGMSAHKCPLSYIS